MTTAIKIEGLTKRFDRLTAVDGLSLEVPEGSVFGFLGANGAGKTTTLRMIAGLARPTSGCITVGGVASDAGARYRRQIGYLCQDPAFYGWMTGREVLRYASGFHDEPPGGVEAEMDRLLDLVGLTGAADRRCAEYSGGMRQRLGIAAALTGRPRILLLDEPATGLDPLGRRDVLGLMEALRSTTTIFYSTHILDDVQRVSDRVAVVDRGRLIVADRTSQLLAGYTRNSLRVEMLDATAETAATLAALEGVTAVSAPEATQGGLAFQVDFADVPAHKVQRAVTRLASAGGLTVVEARPITLDLEEVFLSLVGDQEAAA